MGNEKGERKQQKKKKQSKSGMKRKMESEG